MVGVFYYVKEIIKGADHIQEDYCNNYVFLVYDYFYRQCIRKKKLTFQCHNNKYTVFTVYIYMLS